MTADPQFSKSAKKELRRSLLKARQAIHPDLWRQKSDRICTHLQALPLWAQAQTVLAFFTFRQEPDLTPLFSLPKRWGFPRCVETHLIWQQWSPQSSLDLQTSPYGTLEPPPQAPLIQPDEVDLILLPAIACDVRGYRLGYGGGFYDRMLSQPQWCQTPTIGIVFEDARLPELPIDPWDQPLQGICTEAGLFVPTPPDMSAPHS